MMKVHCDIEGCDVSHPTHEHGLLPDGWSIVITTMMEDPIPLGPVTATYRTGDHEVHAEINQPMPPPPRRVFPVTMHVCGAHTLAKFRFGAGVCAPMVTSAKLPR